ncbi:hypothetical protein DB30_03725 [Enhygromyxa salina]|uniref:Uncharacterized protein n=1 Tax=Enhygromyxa salina TaxID=215803 RepID=A0A0C2A153_9BACT|nr:hypothetical protein DB30_03725 [Enhygromyxa salina]
MVEAKLEDGVRTWFQVAPNAVACVDRNLCCVGFMHSDDAAAFVRDLEGRGLEGERGGSYQDVAIMGPEGPWRHACSWLEQGRYSGAQAIWLRGSDPEPLVVPMNYRPNGTILNMSAEQARDRLEFLRTEGDVDVFWDKQLQRELFRGRTTRKPPATAEHEQRFRATASAMRELLSFDVHPKPLSWLQRRRLRKGLATLEELAQICDEPWRVWFHVGLARRSLPDAEGAYAAFRAAYHDNPDHVDVAREYAGQCLTLGRGSEAVKLNRRNCELHPEDAGIRSNLALALVIAGDMEAAKAEVTRARNMEPDDEVTAGLERMIDQILAGALPRPQRYP